MTKYMHTRFNGTLERRITIAGVLNEETNQMTFGISVCRPGDNFDRKKARLIAEGRARKAKTIAATVNLNEEQVATINKTFNIYATELAEVKEMEIQAREINKNLH